LYLLASQPGASTLPDVIDLRAALRLG
jgi:hypothetical protein